MIILHATSCSYDYNLRDLSDSPKDCFVLLVTHCWSPVMPLQHISCKVTFRGFCNGVVTSEMMLYNCEKSRVVFPTSSVAPNAVDFMTVEGKDEDMLVLVFFLCCLPISPGELTIL